MVVCDPKCEELARHVLGGGADNLVVRDLTQHIQLAIQDWLRGTGHKCVTAGSET